MHPITPLLAAALAASPQPAEEPKETENERTKITASIQGDATAKANFNLQGSDARFRLNAVGSVGNDDYRLVGATRHDAYADDPGDAYGVDAVRAAVDGLLRGTPLEGSQFGISSIKWPDGRKQYAQGFKATRGEHFNAWLVLNAPLSGELDESVIAGQYSRDFGDLGARAFILDDIGRPRVQKLELELTGSPISVLGGARPVAQLNVVGTPGGYDASVGVGVRMGFNYAPRAGQR